MTESRGGSYAELASNQLSPGATDGHEPKVVPVLSFRVFPGRSKYGAIRGHWLWVHVFETVDDLAAFARANGSAITPDMRPGGMCMEYSVFRHGPKGKWRKSLECGAILLYRDRCGVMVVTHEALHGVIAWAKATGDLDLYQASLDREPTAFASEEEETLCYALGDTCAQIYDQLWKHDLIRNEK